jgi:hypothetical protein
VAKTTVVKLTVAYENAMDRNKALFFEHKPSTASNAALTVAASTAATHTGRVLRCILSLTAATTPSIQQQ